MQSSMSDLFKKLDISERACALILGVVFLFVGIAGFVPALMTLPTAAPDVVVDAPRLSFDAGYGYVLGVFPTNFLHNALHIVVGVLGIAAATSLGGAIAYNQGFAVAYVLIVLMGLIPATNTTFGLMPIYGNNIWLNALTAIAAGYMGFIKPNLVKAEIKSQVTTPTAS